MFEMNLLGITSPWMIYETFFQYFFNSINNIKKRRMKGIYFGNRKIKKYFIHIQITKIEK